MAAAIEHAGVDEDDLYLLPVPGAAVQGANKAACYPPEEELFEDSDDLLRGDILEEANQPDVQARHRIAIYEDVDEDDPVEVAIMAAKLRHEIRHAEQRLVCGSTLFDLDELARLVAEWKVGDLPGGIVFYNMQPLELDCNAAATVFLRDEHPDQVGAILHSEDAPLARSMTPPGRLEDLPAKTVAYIFTLREVAEDPERGGAMSFEDRLRSISPEAARQWQALARPDSA